MSMKLKPLAAFCRRMGVGLRSGVDILRLLDMETRVGTQQHREVFARMQTSIAVETLCLSHACREEILSAAADSDGECVGIGGRMDSMFTYMADYYDQLLQTRSFFLNRISMPLFQLGFAILVIGGVILFQSFMSSVERQVLTPPGQGCLDSAAL